MSLPAGLNPKLKAFADLVADRVAERLIEALGEVLAREPLLREPEAIEAEPQLVDAATIAAKLGVTRRWVYDHQIELGAVRLTDGAKPRLRFPLRESPVIPGNPRQSRTDVDRRSGDSGERA